jgi:hypothetical protein
MIPRGLSPVVVVELVDMLEVVVVVGPWTLTPVMVVVVVEEAKDEAKDEVELAGVIPAPPL